MALRIPNRLVAYAEAAGHGWWLPSVASTVEQLQERWGIEVGLPYEPGGVAAWVAPAVGADGERLALKVGWRHFEADDEAAGLLEWDGDGAVRCRDWWQSDDTSALLLERCVPGVGLSERPEGEQDVVIAGLLRRLWRVPTGRHAFRPLQEMCDRWADEFEARAADAPSSVDPGLARDAMALFRSLPAGAERHVLLCTDLHAENVLAAEREPWLVIDPKPYVGDPCYDALQHILNGPERLGADPGAVVERMADLLDLDPARLRLWLFARCVQESADRPVLAAVAHDLAPG